MGANITGVKSAETSGWYTPVYFQNYANASGAEIRPAAPTPIQPVDITVSAQVTVTYSIR